MSSIKDSLYSSEKVWQVSKDFMGWKKQGSPNGLHVGTNLVTSAKNIAKLLNEFFHKKVHDIRKKIPEVAPNFKICKSIMSEKRCKLQLNHVSIRKVEALIRNLKPSK